MEAITPGCRTGERWVFRADWTQCASERRSTDTGTRGWPSADGDSILPRRRLSVVHHAHRRVAGGGGCGCDAGRCGAAVEPVTGTGARSSAAANHFLHRLCSTLVSARSVGPKGVRLGHAGANHRAASRSNPRWRDTSHAACGSRNACERKDRLRRVSQVDRLGVRSRWAYVARVRERPLWARDADWSYQTFVEGAKVKCLNERKSPCQRSSRLTEFGGSTSSSRHIGSSSPRR